MPPKKVLHGVRSAGTSAKCDDEDLEESRIEKKSPGNKSYGNDIKIDMPKHFDFEKKETWSCWLSRWKRYRRVSGLINKSDSLQVDLFLYCLGEEAEDIFESFCIPRADLCYDLVLKYFQNYFEPKINIIYERARFNRRVQEDGENVDSFITSLHKLGNSCNYRELKDELVRDRIVVGIRDPELSEKLQLDSELSKEKAIKLVKQFEAVKNQQLVVRNKKEEGTRYVDAMYSNKFSNEKKNFDRGNRENTKYQGRNMPVSSWKDRRRNDSKSMKSCSKCGLEHSWEDFCPAKKSRCLRCGKVGHWARRCRRYVRNVETEPEEVESGQEEGQDEESRFVSEVNTEGSTNPWKIGVKVEKIKLTFKIDTGADVSVIPIDMAGRIGRSMEPTGVKLFGPGHCEIKVQGVLRVKLSCKGQESLQELFVAEVNEPLLGRPALTALKLVNVVQTVKMDKSQVEAGYNNIFEKYPKLFSGLGRVPYKFKISLHADAKPWATATPRRIPFALTDKVKAEIEEMVKDGVISPVEEPTPWCSPLTIVPKPDGKLRLCVDYTHLNVAVKREHFMLPTVEDSFFRIRDSKFFSKIDASKGYWQVPIEENSKLLTTFITPFGRFYFNRLPFGICSAPEFYQRMVAQILEKEEGTCNHIDDILVTGKSKEEHDKRLEKVLEKLESVGVTLNKNKCIFGVKEVNFLGHIVGEEGIKADPKKVEAIKLFKAPTNVSETRRFLGMVNYLLKFQPNLASLTKPIRELLIKGNEWVWSPVQESAFKKIKTVLSSPPVLGHYDPNLKCRVTADSSSFGIGAVLEQCSRKGEWKPIVFASRSLTKAETKWAQIEKEALAISWACKRFDRWIYGLKIELNTDHRPLVSIFQMKPLSELSPRLQKLRMLMMRYHYFIQFVPGKDLHVADALSRAPMSQMEVDPIMEDVENFVRCVRANFQVSDERIEEIRAAQSSCGSCILLREYILHGWPRKQELDSRVHEFYSHRYDLALIDNLLVKGDRIVVAKSMQGEMLKRLHEGHLGISKCQRKARSTVWWPRVDQDIQRFVEDCTTCIEERPNPTEPMISSELPKGPWQKIAADIFNLDRRNYLCVQDYYSRFPELLYLERMTTSHIVNKMKSVFARYGIPMIFRCDQGTPFVSKEFLEFSNEYGFKVISSSPRYPKSNGFAESGVKSIKKILKTCKNQDIYLGLLAYRSSPLESGYSPAELFLGRKPRGRIPMLPDKMKLTWPKEIEVRKKNKEIKQRQKENYDRRHNVKELRELKNGEEVWIRDVKQYGRVEGRAEQPRSYMIRSDTGRVLKRNRYHLVPTKKH